MPDQYKEDKTEQPTAKRKGTARKDGNIPQSQDVSLVVLIFGMIALPGV